MQIKEEKFQSSNFKIGFLIKKEATCPRAN